MTGGTAMYDDAEVVCDDNAIVIKHYYPWGAKRIPYASIRRVQPLPLTGVNSLRRWRIWGSGDFRHWWNFDARRPTKKTALVLDVGGWVRPTITPDDPEAVEQILRDHLNDVGR